MTFQFSTGKNLRKGNEECVTLEKRQGQWCFLSVQNKIYHRLECYAQSSSCVLEGLRHGQMSVHVQNRHAFFLSLETAVI